MASYYCSMVSRSLSSSLALVSERKSNIPSCYPMRDLNEDPVSAQSLCYQDKTFCKLYDDFKPGTSYGYSEYDKEMITRTMLKQEAVFQKQVYELHQLYQTQKDLMDEFKKEKMYGCSCAMYPSNSNMLAHQMAPEAAEKLCHVPHPSTAKTHNRKVNAAGLKEKEASFHLLKEVGLQSSPKSIENKGLLKDHKELNSKLKTFPKRMFDLHLPADMYIRSEDATRTEREIVTQSCVSATDPHNVTCSVELDNSAKLDVGITELFSCKENIIPHLHLGNDHPLHGLAVLNEKVKDLHAERSAESGAIMFNDVKSNSNKVEMHLTTMTSKTSLQPGYVIKDIYREETCSRCSDTDKEEIRQNWPMLHNDSGQRRSLDNSGHCHEMSTMLSDSIHLKHNEDGECYLPDQNKRDAWCWKSKQPLENSEISRNLVNLNCPAVAVTQGTLPLSVDHTPTTTPPASSWRKPVKRISYIPVVVQALPCFIGSTMRNRQMKNRNSANGCGKLQSKGTWQPLLRPENKSSRNTNGFFNGYQLEPELSPTSVKRSKLNVVGLGSQKDLSRKCEKSSGAFFGPKKTENIRSLSTAKNSTQMDSRFSEDNTQMACSFDKVAEEIVRDCGNDNCSQRLQSSMLLQAKEGSIKMNGIFDRPGKGTSSVSYPSESLQSFNCSKSVSYHKQSSADDTTCNEKGNHVSTSNRCFKYDTSLKSGLTAKMSVISAVDDAGFMSSTYVPSFDANSTRKIDLGIPVIEQENNDQVSQGENVETNHLKNDLNMPQKMKSSYDTSVGVAADTIVSMSMDVHNNVDNASPILLVPASCDYLCWFTEIVTSSSEISRVPKGRGDGDFETLNVDGLDFFEAMTLKLQEVKEDEHWCRPLQKVKLGDEESSAALLMRSRRGQGRKRRKRKDFQKDILPTLASLSRHEVSEDLHALSGEVMSASCKSRQSCDAKPSTGRRGLNSRTKGRRQQRGLAVTSADMHANQIPVQPTHAKPVVDGRTMME